MLGPVIERTTSDLDDLMNIKQNRLLPVRKQQILDRTKAIKQPSKVTSNLSDIFARRSQDTQGDLTAIHLVVKPTVL
jgi:hypothetical protein